MYRAFAVSCNVNGGRAIAAIALGEVATGAAGRLLHRSRRRHRLRLPAPVQSEQRHLAAQLATQILQAHEQGRFEALGPEEAPRAFARLSPRRSSATYQKTPAALRHL